jgi:hypothetical protein
MTDVPVVEPSMVEYNFLPIKKKQMNQIPSYTLKIRGSRFHQKNNSPDLLLSGTGPTSSESQSISRQKNSLGYRKIPSVGRTAWKQRSQEEGLKRGGREGEVREKERERDEK